MSCAVLCSRILWHFVLVFWRWPSRRGGAWRGEAGRLMIAVLSAAGKRGGGGALGRYPAPQTLVALYSSGLRPPTNDPQSLTSRTPHRTGRVDETCMLPSPALLHSCSPAPVSLLRCAALSPSPRVSKASTLLLCLAPRPPSQAQVNRLSATHWHCRRRAGRLLEGGRGAGADIIRREEEPGRGGGGGALRDDVALSSRSQFTTHLACCSEAGMASHCAHFIGGAPSSLPGMRTVYLPIGWHDSSV